MVKETRNNFFSFLKKNGLKPTSQRNLVVKQLLNGKDRHFTAEDLYDEMTVFRQTREIFLAAARKYSESNPVIFGRRTGRRWQQPRVFIGFVEP